MLYFTYPDSYVGTFTSIYISLSYGVGRYGLIYIWEIYIGQNSSEMC